MKHPEHPFHKTGLCHICGKPTKLLIHVECGKKCDEEKKTKKVFDRCSQQQHENAAHNAAKKAYAAGKIPWFAKQ